MIPYSQRNPVWAGLELGKSGLKMKDFGCLVTCLAMLLEKSPDIILNLLNKANAFTDKGILYWQVAAKTLDFFFDGIAKQLPSITYFPVITETNHFAKKGIPQHFYILLDGKNCIDPLDGVKKLNPYNIVSYRLIRKKVDIYPARPLEVEVRSTIDMTKKEGLIDKIMGVINSGHEKTAI